MLQNLILRTMLCGTGCITQPGCLFHFRPSKIVGWNCFAPVRYQLPKCKLAGVCPLNMFTWFIGSGGLTANSLLHDTTHSYVTHLSWLSTQASPPDVDNILIPVSHCNTLQYTATHCSTLQLTTTHCITTQHTATHCNILQHTAKSRPCCWMWTTFWFPYHTAMHCNTLQHTAAHCNTLQHTATHCNTLQHTATHCNALQQAGLTARCGQYYNFRVTLQHTAMHCNILQCTAKHCHILQRTTTHWPQRRTWTIFSFLSHTATHTATYCSALQRTATHCYILQRTATHRPSRRMWTTFWFLCHTATHCIILQRSATHCNTLQHTATQCNTQVSPPDVDNILIPVSVILTGFYLSGWDKYKFLFHTMG